MNLYIVFYSCFGIQFGIQLVFAHYSKMTKNLIITENVWSDLSYSGTCTKHSILDKTGIWPVIGLSCYTTSICITRGYVKWFFDWYTTVLLHDSIPMLHFLLWTCSLQTEPWFSSQSYLHCLAQLPLLMHAKVSSHLPHLWQAKHNP